MTIDLQTLKCGECGSSALKRPSWGGMATRLVAAGSGR